MFEFKSLRRIACCRTVQLLLVVVFADQAATHAQKLFSNPRQLARGIKLETRPVSHDRLIKLANRAFVGLVQRIEVKNEPIGGGPQAAVRTIEFLIEQVLFDETRELQVGQPYRVRSLAMGSREVKQGEKVLWFLAPNSELGLTQPVGIDSGDFRFLESGDVVNLKQNQNLLNPREVQNQAAALDDSLPEAANRPEFHQKLNNWAVRAAARPSGGPGLAVPYELMFARTRELHDELKPNAPPIKEP